LFGKFKAEEGKDKRRPIIDPDPSTTFAAKTI